MTQHVICTSLSVACEGVAIAAREAAFHTRWGGGGAAAPLPSPQGCAGSGAVEIGKRPLFSRHFKVTDVITSSAQAVV